MTAVDVPEVAVRDGFSLRRKGVDAMAASGGDGVQVYRVSRYWRPDPRR